MFQCSNVFKTTSQKVLCEQVLYSDKELYHLSTVLDIFLSETSQLYQNLLMIMLVHLWNSWKSYQIYHEHEGKKNTLGMVLNLNLL